MPYFSARMYRSLNGMVFELIRHFSPNNRACERNYTSIISIIVCVLLVRV